MNFKTIKTAAELPIKGVELVREDSKIVAVIVAGKLRIAVNGTYSSDLKLTVPQPYEEAERHRVTMKHETFGEKTEYFESSYEATEAVRSYERGGADAKSEKVMALIDDAGKVVGLVGDAVPSAIDADIPF